MAREVNCGNRSSWLSASFQMHFATIFSMGVEAAVPAAKHPSQLAGRWKAPVARDWLTSLARGTRASTPAGAGRLPRT